MAKVEDVVVKLPADLIVKYQWINDYLLNQKETERIFQSTWQAYKYQLRGKMYAYIGVEDKTGRPIITMKLEPSQSDVLRGQFVDVVPGYFMNKLYWTTVFLDSEVPEDTIKHMIESSYQEVIKTFSKKRQSEIVG